MVRPADAVLDRARLRLRPDHRRARRVADDDEKRLLITAICGDLGLLAYFKYYTFAAENINRLLDVFGSGSLPVLRGGAAHRHLVLHVRES